LYKNKRKQNLDCLAY